MKTALKHVLPLAGLMLFAACGDDSSSSFEQSSIGQNNQKFILDEANKKFAIIYDRCYVTSENANWVENVDTSWYHYKFVGDALVVFYDGNTADGYDEKKHEIRDEKSGGEVYKGGAKDNIFGIWKTPKEYCFYYDGEIDCDNDTEEAKGAKEALTVLDIAKSHINLYLEISEGRCPADLLVGSLEDGPLYGLIDEEDDYSISMSDCYAVKIKANGKQITATITKDAVEDGAYVQEVSYSSEGKECPYYFAKVTKHYQLPESFCNVDVISVNERNRLGYIRTYEYGDDEKLYSCLAEMLGVEYNGDDEEHFEDYEI